MTWCGARVAAIVATAAAMLALPVAAAPLRLDVPVIPQAPERCGPAALAMVLRWYGAGPAAVAQADSAYDPVLRGALVTDLAARARAGGFEARVATLAADSLRGLLAEGVPPIVLIHRGTGPVARGHYAVVTGWDPERRVWTLHDGGRKPRAMDERELERRWRSAGRQALIVRRAP